MHRETDADGAEREVRETSGESILESIREAPRSREMASALRRVAGPATRTRVRPGPGASGGRRRVRHSGQSVDL